MLAPIETAEKHFDNFHKERMKYFCHLFSGFLIVTLFLSSLLQTPSISVMILVCIMIVEISVILGWIQNRG
jgi:hypothetical protein